MAGTKFAPIFVLLPLFVVEGHTSIIQVPSLKLPSEDMTHIPSTLGINRPCSDRDLNRVTCHQSWV